jgi:hypothetical protein
MNASLPRLWLPVIGFWLVIGALLCARYWLQAGSVPLFGDTDDAMRMVTAADLLHGQAWQDLMQHRDNAPFGGSMHWSRLVDAPIAGLMALFGSDWAAVFWPVLLLLPLLALSVAVTRQLVDGAGIFTALALPVLTLVLNIEFMPGRVDHHNVQIVLCEALLLVLLTARRTPWGGFLAAILAATSLAIGLEALPVVAATVGIYALLWVAEPAAYRSALIAFGVGFAAAVTGHFLLATAPAVYLAPACDLIAIPYVTIALAGGAALALAALIGSRWSVFGRTALIAGLGIVALGASVSIYPQCLAGPYAEVPADIIDGLFSRIPEAQPLLQRFAMQPVVTWAMAGAALLAVPLTAWIALKENGARRVDWLIVLGLLVAAVAVMVLQIRGSRLAAALALPAAAWLITAARKRYLTRSGISSVFGLLGSWLMFATTIQFFAFNAISTAVPPAHAASARSVTPEDCLVGSRFAALAALPPGRVAAPIGLSSQILHYTAHSVLSAGFHRNTQSIRDVVAFFGPDEAIARRIATERGLDYVAVCPGAAGLEGEVAWGENGATWRWLEPLGAPGDLLQVYRITR